MALEGSQTGLRGAFLTARGVVAHDGVRGLYKGFGTVVCGMFPARMVREWVVRWWVGWLGGWWVGWLAVFCLVGCWGASGCCKSRRSYCWPPAFLPTAC